jgi:hypothetical protein
MRVDSGQEARRWTFPLLAALQLGSVLAFLVFVLFGGPTQNEARIDFELRVLPLTPILWLALSVVGLVALVVWRTGWARAAAHVGTWVSGVFGLVGGAVLAFGMLLMSSYGADFEYPAAPPAPVFATAVTHADGFDDDDPMRGRESVIDVGAHTEAELVAFYREHFPESEGWSDGSPEVDSRDDFSLCLVNTGQSGYDEYVEVYHYGDNFKSGGADRFVVSISRLFVSPDWGSRTTDRCGLAGIWFPSDL